MNKPPNAIKTLVTVLILAYTFWPDLHTYILCCFSLCITYRNRNVASAYGKSFGFGAPDANEIIDGGLFANMAAAKQKQKQ